MCHAEVNAILNKNSADVKGCTVRFSLYTFTQHAFLTAVFLFCCHSSIFGANQIYVALFPCNECAKLIIQSGIAEVVYLSDKYRDTPSMQASRRMMTMAGVSA